MREYIKIATPFVRDMEGTKKLKEGEYRDKTIEYLKNCQWVGTEKIDGTNIRVMWDGHDISFAGRTDRAQLPKNLLEYLNNKFTNDETEQLFEQMFGEKEVVLYGEGYGAGIQKGGAYRKDQSFILFDILLGEVWLQREELEEIAKALDIDIVPIIYTGTLEGAVEYVKHKPLSFVAQEKMVMEGLVCKPKMEMFNQVGERIIVKVKVRDYC